MLRSLISVLFVFLPLRILAQSQIIDLWDSALCQVEYKRTMVLDTLHPAETYIINTLTLRIEPTRCVFYDEKRRNYEELVRNKEYLLQGLKDPNFFKLPATYIKDKIFRNLRLNKTVIQQRYDLCDWELTEDTPSQKWEVSDSIYEILGYECFMATTDFRGRRWIAYFTPEIALKEGPWKLRGLPGLILKANDSKNEYVYEATSIKMSDIDKIRFFNDTDRQVCLNRQNALRDHRRALNKDLTNTISALTGVALSPVKPDNPSRMNYDFEETDYPHI